MTRTAIQGFFTASSDTDHDHEIVLFDKSIQYIGTPTNIVKTILANSNEFYICLLGASTVTYEYDSTNPLHVAEKQRIVDYVIDHDPSEFDYLETSSTFIIQLFDPMLHSTPGVWKTVDQNWITTSMNASVVMPKAISSIFFDVKLYENTSTYTALYCGINGSPVTITGTNILVMPYGRPAKVNGNSMSGRIAEVHNSATISPIDSQPFYVMIFKTA